MRIGWPGQARRSLVRQSPLIRLTRGLPGTTNCCCEHVVQRRLIGRPRRAPPSMREEVAEVDGQVVGDVSARPERPAEDAERQVLRDLGEVRVDVDALGVVQASGDEVEAGG
jgi:hypothetical protein